MKKLEEILERKANKMFREDSGTKNTLMHFITENATFNEFVEFINGMSGVSKNDQLSGYLTNGYAERFRDEVLWPKLRDKYIAKAVEDLEKRISLSEANQIEKP